jgi:eukaryotic-like serine/threonine-protein kinase
MNCLDENDLDDWLGQSLSQDRRLAFEAHIDGCPDCRNLLADCVRDPVLHAALAPVQGAQGAALDPSLFDEEATLERATVVRMSPPPLRQKPQRQALHVGTVVGEHYLVLEALGRGGQADVYRARNRMLGREVALKWYAPTCFRSDDDRARFLSEIRATAKFNHPHIATLYGAGEVKGDPQRGAAFVVLEYMSGGNLRERLAQGPLDEQELWALARALGSALDEAQRLGIVHGDIKPANIMYDRDGLPKLVDFGFSRRTKKREPSQSVAAKAALLDEEQSFVTTVHLGGTSRAHSLAGQPSSQGTPRYMAPEQWWDEPLTAKIDVWAAGAVLYEAQSGKPAFAQTTLVDLCEAVTDPQPVARLQNGAPVFAQLVAACLEKDPRRRADAIELQQRLHELGRSQSPKEFPWQN